MTSFLKKNYLIIFISAYSFLINWFSGNLGVMPIDTFAFFDSGFSILKNKFPIRDFWISTGLIVDYFQAGFFYIFGFNWKSYIFHASVINVIATCSFYYFLKCLNFKSFIIFIYCISFATLCYPVSGTPFAYLHSYVFSLISIFLFYIGIVKENNLIWFCSPFIFFLSFFSMQVPSAYIIIILLIFTFYYFYIFKRLDNFRFFILGSIISFLLFIIFLFLTKTPFQDIIYQYFLFPISIGEGRITSDTSAYVRFSDQLNIKRIFGDFKFLQFFYFSLLLIFVYSSIKKNNKLFILNLLILITSLFFFFNQLNQANQIYIFSLIPILASIINANIINLKTNKRLIFIIIFILIFSTVKYHIRYNLDRKFLDIERLDKSFAVDASKIDLKFKYLKWITPQFDDPNKELELINLALKKINNDKRNKVLITHYQFFSLLLDDDLNMLNRWYVWDNNSHPVENHKYHSIYKKFVNKKIKQNKINVIYMLGSKNEMPFSKIEKYFDDLCFKNYIIVENYFTQHEIVSCKN